MGDSTRTSTPTPAPEQTQEPGHYGAGYGEQVPEDATPQLGPTTDGDPPPTAPREGAVPDRQRSTTRTQTAGEVRDDAVTTTEGDDGEAVVFTPADVHTRPPDQTPTDAAPESEKAGLIFERS